MTNKTLNGLIPFGAFPKTELFTLKSVINIEHSQVISKCAVHELQEINKEEWNQFWILYNLFQFFPLTPFKEETDPEFEYEITDLLNSFDESYHSILRELFDEGLVQNEEDEQKLYALCDDRGNVVAEADLINYKTNKVYEPFSQEDEKVFKEKGFDIITKSS